MNVSRWRWDHLALVEGRTLPRRIDEGNTTTHRGPLKWYSDSGYRRTAITTSISGTCREPAILVLSKGNKGWSGVVNFAPKRTVKIEQIVTDPGIVAIPEFSDTGSVTISVAAESAWAQSTGLGFITLRLSDSAPGDSSILQTQELRIPVLTRPH